MLEPLTGCWENKRTLMETYQLSREKAVMSRIPGARDDLIFDENVVKLHRQTLRVCSQTCPLCGVIRSFTQPATSERVVRAVSKPGTKQTSSVTSVTRINGPLCQLIRLKPRVRSGC